MLTYQYSCFVLPSPGIGLVKIFHTAKPKKPSHTLCDFDDVTLGNPAVFSSIG